MSKGTVEFEYAGIGKDRRRGGMPGGGGPGEGALAVHSVGGADGRGGQSEVRLIFDCIQKWKMNDASILAAVGSLSRRYLPAVGIPGDKVVTATRTVVLLSAWKFETETGQWADCVEGFTRDGLR
jgi:hypothetical protein